MTARPDLWEAWVGDHPGPPGDAYSGRGELTVCPQEQRYQRWPTVRVIVALLAGMAGTSCTSTMDRVSRLPDGATRQEVIDLLGPSVPDAAMPLGVATIPSGCASHLVYKDQYDAAALRAVHNRLQSCGGTWLHVCFDSEGRVMRGLRFSMITC